VNTPFFFLSSCTRSARRRFFSRLRTSPNPCLRNAYPLLSARGYSKGGRTPPSSLQGEECDFFSSVESRLKGRTSPFPLLFLFLRCLFPSFRHAEGARFLFFLGRPSEWCSLPSPPFYDGDKDTIAAFFSPCYPDDAAHSYFLRGPRWFFFFFSPCVRQRSEPPVFSPPYSSL